MRVIKLQIKRNDDIMFQVGKFLRLGWSTYGSHSNVGWKWEKEVQYDARPGLMWLNQEAVPRSPHLGTRHSGIVL